MRVKVQDPRTPEGYRITDLNRRKAIAEKCLNCSGFSPSERSNCTCSDCHLYFYRSGIGKQDAKARNNQIRAYCREHCMDGNGWLVSNCTSPDCPLFCFRKTVVDRSMEI